MPLQKKVKEEEKTKEVAELNGQSKAFTVIGAGSALGWMFIEMLPMLEGVADLAYDAGKLKTRHKLAVAAGIVALGATCVAWSLHSRAQKIEAEKKKLHGDADHSDWGKHVSEERLLAEAQQGQVR